MNEEQSNLYIFERTPVSKAILQLSVPMMLGMSVGVIQNIMNAFFIGRLHNTAMLSAVTLGLPVFTILMALGNIYGVGGGTYISRLLGEKRMDEAKSAAVFAIGGSFATGLLCILLSLLFVDPIVHLLGADAATFDLAKRYTVALLIGSPFIIANFAFEQVVRAEGAAKASMSGMFICTLVNLALDPLLILYLDWNVIGAAVSMALANGISVLYYAWYLQRKSQYLSLSLRSFKLTMDTVSNTFKIGISEFLLSMFLIVTTLLLNHYSVLYGDGVVAGFGIALRIVQLPEFLCMGLFMGIVPLLAYSYAANNMARFKRAAVMTGLWIGIVTVLFSGIVFFLRTHVLQMFSADGVVIEIGTSILTAMLISSLFTGFTGLFTSLFQAAGQARQAVVMSVTQGLLFIPVIYLMHEIFGLHGIVWSLAVTEILTCLTGVVMFLLLNRKINENRGKDSQPHKEAAEQL
ncbi:MATE family efflux transporter [Paenibacillus rhizophilus]|uniref:Multidrug export protein MepA n=1 Tax=Paenibacillus rhizophilus TaxID=1850366 RepID=A0A3N9PBU2_9BACL|nr:MATE family efflux transporter [Paenibacillus rhizophilus]RQW13713.1 MATE family efflux transporter [Paenibacillus rhizophilus]